MALVNDDAATCMPPALDFLLSQWGIWSRMARPGPKSYTSSAGKIQEMLVQQNTDNDTFLAGDDLAEAVDAAVNKQAPGDKSILVSYFVYRYPLRLMARMHGVSREGMLNLISRAAARVESTMED